MLDLRFDWLLLGFQTASSSMQNHGPTWRRFLGPFHCGRPGPLLQLLRRHFKVAREYTGDR